jgi:drug/metabolite transporter (DMT)-like permease
MSQLAIQFFRHRASVRACLRLLQSVPPESSRGDCPNEGHRAVRRTRSASAPPRKAAAFAAVGLCNGLSVLAMYAALEYGPVTVVSPLIAGYPLVTLLLSRAFLEREEFGPQLIGGVTGAVCGVVLLLVA